jgi:hypothetical protein
MTHEYPALGDSYWGRSTSAVTIVFILMTLLALVIRICSQMLKMQAFELNDCLFRGSNMPDS